MDEDTDSTLRAIGPRLRRLRRARGLTLTELSERTGLSVSLLSRLETGLRRPTLDALIPLARAYRVSLDRLAGMPELGDPRIHLQPRRHAAGGVVVPLTPHRAPVQVFKHVLGPRAPRLVSHEGYAWLYVLSGRLRLLLDDEEHELGVGETAEFDPVTPHWFGPAGDAVEILHIFGPRSDSPLSRVSPAERRDAAG
ncbi:helix-turn-helix domain-containing protein [Gulosibacter sp. 10]|uniref:helix-turn-helix domain-containing protein n=1 Tax=Gulosibacter sp. 10 TaxID=1255570 RepID=UPI00097EFA3A|nr:helix-turn-helix domain-containing protein [Gulosibacter sp. 10]SJM58040.1 putative regulatory protein [Gulosibacter sp. 10]